MFFLQAEDGIRDLVRSRGLGDVYKRQVIVEVSAPIGGKPAGDDAPVDHLPDVSAAVAHLHLSLIHI